MINKSDEPSRTFQFGAAQQRAAVRRVMELMGVPGKSGEELPVAEFIHEELIRAGMNPAQITTDSAHRKTPLPSQTGNLIITLPGTIRGPRRLLMAHMDTVPICVGSKPRRNGNVVTSADPQTGLGADDRAGVATVLTAVTELLRQDLPYPPLTFLWTIQEENGLHGARLLNHSKLRKPRFAFNWDGGSPTKMTIGATGGYRMKITVHGKASHAGSAPAEGVSAIAIASLAIAELHKQGWHGEVRKGKQQGTTNVGYIHGGEATNVVTDQVVLRAEARSHNPRFRMRLVSEIEKAFRRAAREVVSTEGVRGSVEFEGQLDYESFAIPIKSDVVQVASAAMKYIGEEPEFAITNGGLDANWLNSRGLPTVSMGCGQRNQHTVTEALHIDEYLTACRIALTIATGSEDGA